MKKIFYIILFSLTFNNCSNFNTDQKLKRLYKLTNNEEMIRPVVFIPGLLGTKLRHKKNKDEIWPGSIMSLLFSTYHDIAYDIDKISLEPEVNRYEPFELFFDAAGKDFYGKIYTTLTEIGGYQKPISKGGPKGLYRRIYIFTYDWRQDLVKSAKQLNNLINTIRNDYHRPHLKVDIVAHSMGGLIARYFVKYGDVDVLSRKVVKPTFKGARKVNQMILLATPNWGSIYGLQKFIMGYRIGFKTILPEVLLTFPSMYQLLPHPDRDWMIDIKGTKINRSLYEIKTWQKYKWSIYNPSVRENILNVVKNKRIKQPHEYLNTLTLFFNKNIRRAKLFKEAIDKDNSSNPLRYIVFGGDCILTPARCLLEKIENKMIVRLHPNQIKYKVKGIPYEQIMLEPGDGSVTKPSLLGRNSLDVTQVKVKDSDLMLKYSFFLCNDHESLPGDINFQDNLLNILLNNKTSIDHFESFLNINK